MVKILREQSGMVLALAVILVMSMIIIVMTMATLVFSNYLSARSVNTKENVYYTADYGMEKTLKNLAMINEEAKTYSVQKMFLKDGFGKSIFEKILSNEEIQDPNLTDDERKTLIETKVKTQLISFYIEYMNGGNDSNNPTGIKKLEQDMGSYISIDPSNTNALLSPLKYKASFEPSEGPYLKINTGPVLDEDNVVKINVFGSRFKDGEVQFERQIYAEVSMIPWDFDAIKLLEIDNEANFQESMMSEYSGQAQPSDDTASQQRKTYKILKWKTVK